MVEELKEGIKQAIARGEDLNKVLQSFFNAGYSKEEIDQAKRSIDLEKFQNLTQPDKKKEVIKNNIKESPKPVVQQKVSDYQQPIKKKMSLKKVISLVVLFIVLGFLIFLGIILFLLREEVIISLKDTFG